MQLREYRIVLPFTLEEYKLAQLYMVAKYSASESSGDDGDGVEVLKNEPFQDGDKQGQYTHKIYHLANKLPSWLVTLLPRKALMLEEEAWNAYPHCITVLKCPFFNKFKLILESNHISDRGETDNALNLDPKTIKKRQVECLDIAIDPVEKYVEDEDPTKFKSKKTGRGPLTEGWQQTCEPVMCAYKLVTVDVPYWGFGSKVERFISKTAQRKVLLEGHRKCFCWLDEWFGLTMDDIRRMEQETAEAIARARQLMKVQAEAHTPSGAGPMLTDTGDQLPQIPETEVLDETVTPASTVADPDTQQFTQRRREVEAVADKPPSTPHLHSTPRDGQARASNKDQSPRYSRRPSLVGPAVAVGINTMSASDSVNSASEGQGTSVPTPPSSATAHTMTPVNAEGDKLEPSKDTRRSSGDSLPSSSVYQQSSLVESNSYGSLHYNSSYNDFSIGGSSNDLLYNGELSRSASDETGGYSSETKKCLEILERAIALTKGKTKNMANGSRSSSLNGSSRAMSNGGISFDRGSSSYSKLSSTRQPGSSSASVSSKQDEPYGVDYYISVIDQAIAVLKGSR